MNILVPLSDDWRIAPSQHQALDLANSIRSLQKVIGIIDDRKCTVTYSHLNESYFSATNMMIRIDPAFAMKSSPINGNDFDVLAGLGVHEGLHSHCLSDSIRKDGTEVYKGVARIGEEIYIDNYGLRNYPILGQYIRKSRNGYKIAESLVAWDDIYMTWCAIAVYGMMPQGDWLSDIRKVAMLKLLMELSTKLMKKDLTFRDREDLYRQTSHILEQMVTRQTIEDQLSKDKSKEPPLELDAPFGLSTDRVKKLSLALNGLKKKLEDNIEINTSESNGQSETEKSEDKNENKDEGKRNRSSVTIA